MPYTPAALTTAQQSALTNIANGQLGTTAAGGTFAFGQGKSGGDQIKSIQDLYTANLGRAGDTAGMEYWNSQFMGDGVIDDSERKMFMEAAVPEYLARKNLPTPAAAVTPTTTTVTQQVPDPVAPAYTQTATVAATPWVVDKNMTAAGQFKDLSAENSPLMQQARTKALEQMNGRGIVNSSMALTAGDQAAYNAILPLAQQDATTYANAGQFNAGQTNQFGLQNNAQAYTQSNMAQGQGYTQANMALANKYGLNNMAVNQGYTQANMGLANGYTQANMGLANGYNVTNAATQQGYTQANMKTQAEIQKEFAGATALYSNLANQTATATGIQQWGLNSIQGIESSDLSADAKNAAIARITSYLNDSWKIQGDWHTTAATTIRAIFGNT